MSKDKRKEVFNIAVVGLSGTEQVKGTSGVGKSCLCNRFVREEADDYYPDHTSVLSQSDFGGRVVNNDHFLYWGEVKKKDDNDQDYKFNVIEQTEFIDDQSYQAHRSSSNQVYHKRSAQIKITSAEKMMYICTDQLGIESDFEAKPMPDGKLSIDGFVLCFDVSSVTNRSFDDQIRFVQNCYHYLAKTKKPIVLALTKCDEAVLNYTKEMERLVSAGGKRNWGIPVVETSASENINVTLVFLSLAQLIDKTRQKSKIVSFEDSAQARRELLRHAKERLEKLLEANVTNYHESWQAARRLLEDKQQYLRYVGLEGKNAASKIFRKHVNCLRDEHRLNLQNEYMRFFSKALRKILPDLAMVRSTWNDTLQVMQESAEFENWIVSLDELDAETNGRLWYEHPHVHSMEDRRIPLQLLQTADAERYFLFHRQDLEAKQKCTEMKKKFRQLLSQSSEVLPGRDWDDVPKQMKTEFLSVLSESELSTIYEQYQAEIIDKAKNDFQELLYEKSDIFMLNNIVTHVDIQDALKSDPRYVAMLHLRKDQNEILTRHISNALYPPPDNWGARCLAAALKSRRARMSLNDSKMTSPADRWQLTSDSNTLNVVLLGADGLSQELANEITVHSSEEYTVDGYTHPLRLRSIDGDVLLPGNSFKTSSFFPHGCIAVYSSMESLLYIESSLESTVVSSGETPDSDDAPPFQGLPVSILLASHSNSEKEVNQLRDAGERLASRIGCPFIDVLPPEYAYNRRFHESQIKEAMKSLVGGIEERAGRRRGGGDAPHSDEDATNVDSNAPTDLKIIMCTRKDHCQTAEVALSPLLKHTSFHDPCVEEPEGEETEDTVFVETYLGTQRRRIAVTLTSYQCVKTLMSKDRSIHGFILVYDTQLKSSFSIMKAFANNTASSYPLLVLCVSANDQKPAASFFQQDSESRQLVVNGNNLADQLQAKFVNASARHRRQSEVVYSTFFKDAWEHKEETESIHKLNRAVQEENVASNKDDDAEKQDRPVPAPRSMTSNLHREKANSTEQLSTKSFLDHSLNAASLTPPSSLQLINYGDGQQDDGSTTPGLMWSSSSEDCRIDTPNTSPTAGLLENEENPDYSDYSFDSNRKTPPAKSSHLYPGGSCQPGKLDPDLLNKVAAGIGKPPAFEIFPPTKRNHSDPPYMAINDQFKIGGVKVLPSPGEPESKSTAPPKPSPQEAKSEYKPSRPSLLHGFEKGMHRRPAPRNGKRFPLMSVDAAGTPTHTQTPPSVRQTRYSTADLLSNSFSSRLDTDGTGLSKKSYTASHEDLLLSSPSVPSGLSSAGMTERITPKDKIKKLKEEKKKEEKKNKEKEKRFRYKETQKNAQNLPASVAIGNKHNISDYFNKGLDDVIQSLNHLVPLFVEKCVRYIEATGLHTEGLYRVPANARERESIITKFDEDNNYDIQLSDSTVHTVAGCLTWFFSHKNLPEPLISTHLHEELEEAVTMPVRNLAIRGVIRKLPFSNYATFKFICSHLKRVSDHSDENKMTVDNLAICWCNTLFRPSMEGHNALPKAFYKDVLTICIDQCGFMFFDQAEH